MVTDEAADAAAERRLNQVNPCVNSYGGCNYCRNAVLSNFIEFFLPNSELTAIILLNNEVGTDNHCLHV